MAHPPRNAPTRKTRQKHSSQHWHLPKGVFLLALAAGSASLSQLNLAPVYGSIPASLWHFYLVLLALSLAVASAVLKTPRFTPNLERWIPVLAVYIPTSQSILFGQSSRLGPIAGPAVTEALTILPLIFTCTIFMLRPDPNSQSGRKPPSSLLGLAAVVLFPALENISSRSLRSLVGLFPFVVSHFLQLILALSYVVSSPSRLLLLTLPSLFHSAFLNVRMPFPHSYVSLNETLHSHQGYAILDRSESITGYLSVIEGENRAFRALRCGHSLLGGEWLGQANDLGEKPKVSDPIYAVFVMLEAVRLVEADGPGVVEKNKDRKRALKQGLVIGLGVGTSAGALIAHGVNTTSVEIDPRVRDYATSYFGLDADHTSVIEDAVSFVDRAVQENRRYDYIIHDVFTGGAEPVHLFTIEFIKGLHDLLESEGAIAINYAGDVSLPSPRLVIGTIQAVFPACRLFRDEKGPSAVEGQGDFTNLVIFCIKSGFSFSFRRPTDADYLGTMSRRQYLMPRHEVSLSDFKIDMENGDVLTRQTKALLERWHQVSAVTHWRVMRRVLPAAVWENW